MQIKWEENPTKFAKSASFIVVNLVQSGGHVLSSLIAKILRQMLRS